MNKTTHITELYTQFTDLITRGTEDQIRKFLTDHFNEFPQELQGEILRAFLSEAVSDGLEAEKAIGKFQDEAVVILQKMEQLTQKLEDKKRLGELEGQIKP